VILEGVPHAVLQAVAGALQLDDAERDHLFDLDRAQGPLKHRRPSETPGVTGSSRRTAANVRRHHHTRCLDMYKAVRVPGPNPHRR